MRFSLPILFALMLGLSGCSTDSTKSQDAEVELTISAAASLQEALAELQKEFEEVHPNIHINFNFGASGALQQQIIQGAPVDLFISAAEDKFQQLVTDGFIDRAQAVQLLGNKLVFITPLDGPNNWTALEDLVKANKISIGTPDTVPAGSYAKEALTNAGIWSRVEDQMIYAKDVRQVLTYVETGNVDAGIVYNTDARLSEKINIVTSVETSLHPPIIYPLGVVKNSDYQEESTLFYEYLQTDSAKELFESYGFTAIK